MRGGSGLDYNTCGIRIGTSSTSSAPASRALGLLSRGLTFAEKVRRRAFVMLLLLVNTWPRADIGTIVTFEKSHCLGGGLSDLGKERGGGFRL